MKLAPCPARSVTAATFAFYLADSISSVHEFAPINFHDFAGATQFVRIRAIRVYLSETLARAEALRSNGVQGGVTNTLRVFGEMRAATKPIARRAV